MYAHKHRRKIDDQANLMLTMNDLMVKRSMLSKYTRPRLLVVVFASLTANAMCGTEGSPRWEGPGANAKPRSNSDLAEPHVAHLGVDLRKEHCTRIQHQTYRYSWETVASADKATWNEFNCPVLLRERPAAGAKGCSTGSADRKSKERNLLLSVKDKYKGERCALVCNGPSLNKIRWDWQPNFKVVMGMNKVRISQGGPGSRVLTQHYIHVIPAFGCK